MTEFAGDGKNTVSMLDINDFKRHGSRPVNGVHVATGRTETGMASKGNIFESTTTRAGKHGATKGRIATRDTSHKEVSLAAFISIRNDG